MFGCGPQSNCTDVGSLLAADRVGVSGGPCERLSWFAVDPRVTAYATRPATASVSTVAIATVSLDTIAHCTNAPSRVARRGFVINDGGPVGASSGSVSATTWNGNRT